MFLRIFQFSAPEKFQEDLFYFNLKVQKKNQKKTNAEKNVVI